MVALYGKCTRDLEIKVTIKRVFVENVSVERKSLKRVLFFENVVFR
jgi:hypothetical protein